VEGSTYGPTRGGHRRWPWGIDRMAPSTSMVMCPNRRCGQWGGHELKLSFFDSVSIQNCMSQTKNLPIHVREPPHSVVVFYGPKSLSLSLSPSPLPQGLGFLQFMFKLGFHGKVKPRKIMDTKWKHKKWVLRLTKSSQPHFLV
jgi:hypothetical protein